NASPIVITTGSTATLTTGATVNIVGVNGNTAANGTWTITVRNATQFALNGSTGNGAYTNGGFATPTSVLARLPGKVNLNTIWDLEIFLALCDPGQPGSHITAADVLSIWNTMLPFRDPAGRPGANSNPFRPLSTGDYPLTGDLLFPTGAGVQSTLLKANDASFDK